MSNRNRFPLYLPPKANELFTSWVVRNARYNEENTVTFARKLFETQNFWDRDIDRFCPSHFMLCASAKLPITHYELKQMTMQKYNGILYPRISPLLHMVPLILPIGIYHRKRKLFGLMFCPVCIQKNKCYSTNYRISVNIICLDCKGRLYDRCLKCGSPVVFHRITKGNVNLDIDNCSFCLKKIYNSGIIIAPDNEINYQKILNSALDGNNVLGYPNLDFFSVLMFLINAIRRNSNSNLAFRNLLKSYSHVKIYNFDIKKKYFSLLDMDLRRHIVLTAIEIMKGGMWEFMHKCKDNKVSYSCLLHDKSEKKLIPNALNFTLSSFLKK